MVSETPTTPITKPALFAAATFLTIPAFIPFYFALDEEDTTTLWLFVGTGVTVLLANTMAFILIYRWIVRLTHD